MFVLTRWYNKVLKNYPKRTNAVTTGALFGTGDFIAQCLYHDDNDQQEYNFHRTARGVIYGCIFSFIGDKWFRFLNVRINFPNKPQNSPLNPILRVVIDQLCFAPLGIPFYFFCITLLEGKNLNDSISKVEKTWWTTLKANYGVWPAVQLINFSLVPVHHRLLTINLVAIFWNTYISYKNSNTSPQ